MPLSDPLVSPCLRLFVFFRALACLLFILGSGGLVRTIHSPSMSALSTSSALT